MPDDQRIHVAVGHSVFTMRAAGVIRQGLSVLLHKTQTDNYWSLPGGRVEAMEFSAATLERELAEETGQTAIVGRLLGVSENLFSYQGKDHHEIGFYYQVSFSELQPTADFTVSDGENELLFRWFPVGEVGNLQIYPAFAKQLLVGESDKILHHTASMQNLHEI